MKKKIATGLSILMVTGSMLGLSVNADNLLGDVNEDGLVNASDASAVLTACAKMGAGFDSDLTESQLLVADFDQNGELNSSDASAILAYCAELGAGLDDNIETQPDTEYNYDNVNDWFSDGNWGYTGGTWDGELH